MWTNAQPGTRLTFRSLVTAQTTQMPTETCMIPFSAVGGSTMAQELPAQTPRKVQVSYKGKAPPSPSPHAPPVPTFGVVSADAFTDQGRPLPECGPEEVMRPAANLGHLPRGIHQGPRRAFRVAVADAFSVPYLRVERHSGLEAATIRVPSLPLQSPFLVRHP